MKKNIISVIVAVVLIPAVLAGCGKKSYFESSGAAVEKESDGDFGAGEDSADSVAAPDAADTKAASDTAASEPATQEVVVKVYVYGDGDAEVAAEGAEVSDRRGLVDINSATREELMTLSGIGETRADAIISYRNEQGRFLCEEDLKKVSGIGDSTFEKIRDKITV